MCAVEEAARQDLKIKTPRTFSIKQQLMAYCEKCKLTEQNIVSNPEITKVEGCDNLTYFEIMHLQLKNYLWHKYDDNGVGRRQLWKYHPLYIVVKYLLKEQLHRHSSRIRTT